MAVGYRDVYIVLRARDEASRTIARMGSRVGAMGKQLAAAEEKMAVATDKSTRMATKARENYTRNVARSHQQMQRSIEAAETASAKAIKKTSDGYIPHFNKANRAIASHERALKGFERTNGQAMRTSQEMLRNNARTMADNTKKIQDNTRYMNANGISRKSTHGQGILAQNDKLAAQNQVLRNNNVHLGQSVKAWQQQERTIRQGLTGAKQQLKGYEQALAQKTRVEQQSLRQTVQAFRQEHDQRKAMYASNRQQAIDYANLSRDTVRRELQALKERQAAFQQSAARVGALSQGMMTLGLVLGGAGAGGVRAFNSMASAAIDFERQAARTLTQVDNMQGAMAGVNATVGDMKRIVREVGTSIGAPFEEMQNTLYAIFSSMDVNLNEARDLLRGFSLEAVAGQADLQSVMRSSVAMMNAFGMGASDLTRIQDMQFQTVRKGIITYDELSSNIGKLIPSAVRAGQSIETMGGMLGFLTRQGLSAQMASTSAARALEVFSAPGTVAKFEQMGISVRDASGEFRPLVEVVNQLNKSLEGMPGPERAKVMHELLRGSGSSNIQARRFWETVVMNTKEFNQQIEWATNNQGAFAAAVSIMTNTTAYELDILSNRWAILREEIGESIIPLKMQLMRAVLAVVDALREMDPEARRLIVRTLAIASALAVVTGPLLIMGGLFGMVASQLAMLTGSFPVALAMMAKFGAGAMGIVALLGLLVFNADKLIETFRDLNAWWSSLGTDWKVFYIALGLVGAAVVTLTGYLLISKVALDGFALRLMYSKDALIKFGAALKGLATGHPVLLALTVVLGALYLAARKAGEGHRLQREAIADYTQQLGANSEAIGHNITKLQELNRLNTVRRLSDDEGVQRNMRRAQVSIEELTKAIYKEGNAYGTLTERLKAQKAAMADDPRSKLGQDIDALLALIERESAAVGVSTNEYIGQQKALGGVAAQRARYIELQNQSTPLTEAEARAQYQLARSLHHTDTVGRGTANGMGVLEDGMDGAAGAAKELSERAKAFQEVAKNMTSPMSAYNSALEANQETKRKWAEAHYKDSKNASDKVQAAVDGVQVKLSEWNAQMEQQVADYRVYMQNLAIISQNGGSDVIEQIMAMGDAGPVMAAELAKGGDEAERTFNNLRDVAAITSDESAEQFDKMVSGISNSLITGMAEANRQFFLAMQIMEENATTGGNSTAQAIAEKLRLSVREVREIAKGYGIVLLEGINPLLSGLGRPIMSMPSTWGAGSVPALNSGGLVPGTGPNKDTVPAMLTPGEFVLRRDAVRKIDPHSLHMLNQTGSLEQVAAKMAHYNTGGFVSHDDIPKPPSYASHGTVVGPAGRASGEKQYDLAKELVEKYGAPALGPGIGYQKMWDAVSKKFGAAVRLHSGYRPGAITATGNPSYHGMGRAIDITPSMDIFNWLLQHYARQSKEIIFSPANQRQIRNGQNHMYSGVTRDMHWDHIHWAMAKGGVVTQPTYALIGEAGPEVVIPLDKLSEIMQSGYLQDASQITDITGALQAALNSQRANQDLVAARKGVENLKKEISLLSSQRNATLSLLAKEMQKPRIMTAQEELGIINQTRSIRDLKQEIKEMKAAMKGGIQPTEQYTEALAKVDAASAELAKAKFEVERSKAQAASLRRSGDEVKALLLEYEAEYNLAQASQGLADAQKSLSDQQKNVSIPTAEDLRIKELELAIAQERLTELRKEAAGPSERVIELQNKLAEQNAALATSKENLAGAEKTLIDATYGAIAAQLGMHEAFMKVINIGPQGIKFFQSIAKQAGISSAAISSMTNAVTAIQAVNPVRAAVQASGIQYYTSGGDHYLRGSSGRWYKATGSGQVAAMKALFGSGKDVPASHIGSIYKTVVDAFGGPGGIEAVVAGSKPLPKLARGAIVRATQGGTPVVIGEGGRDEAVIPLPNNMKQMGSTINISDGAVQITINGPVGMDTVEALRQSVDEALGEFAKEFTDSWRSQ